MGIIQNQTGLQRQGQTAPTQANAGGSVASMMSSILDGEKMRRRFDELLGKRAPQFISSLVSMVNADAKLQEAFYDSPMSVIQAGLKAATFDLPVDQNLGYAYIVPFVSSKRNANGEWEKRTEATFILGWKGMHQLALRTGVYKTINVTDVREGELRSYNRMTEEVDIVFEEDEEKRESLPIVGYCGYYRLINGAEKTVYMTKGQIEAHEKKFRKGQNMSKGWRDDWDAMARKTVYRILIGKWGVMSIDYQTHGSAVQMAQQMQEEGWSDTPVSDTATFEVDPESGEVSADGSESQ